ncbi:unnamed protein product, partial [Sphacelaria rigidula]
LSRSEEIKPHIHHVDIKFYYVFSLVADNVVDVKCLETQYQSVDILTKSLGTVNCASNRLMLQGT